MDNLFEQIVNISKASAYDIAAKKCEEQAAEIRLLKAENEELKIRLKWAEERVKLNEQFRNEIKAMYIPTEKEIYPLSEIDQEIEDELNTKDDLKNVL